MSHNSLGIGESAEIRVGDSVHLTRKTEDFVQECAYMLTYAGMPDEQRCSLVVQQTPNTNERTPYPLYYPSQATVRLRDLKLHLVATESELSIRNLDPSE